MFLSLLYKKSYWRLNRCLLGCICLAFIFFGCISGPSLHYYTLENTIKPVEDASPLCLQVASIRLSESLKRKEIMVRKNSVQVDYYSIHLWASSLEELITNKINQTFLCYQSEKKLPDYYLHIDVLNFEEVESSTFPVAYVKFVVQFLNPSSMEVLAQKIYSIEKESTNKGVPELVKTFSTCVDEVINKIYVDAKNIKKPQ